MRKRGWCRHHDGWREWKFRTGPRRGGMRLRTMPGRECGAKDVDDGAEGDRVGAVIRIPDYSDGVSIGRVVREIRVRSLEQAPNHTHTDVGLARWSQTPSDDNAPSTIGCVDPLVDQHRASDDAQQESLLRFTKRAPSKPGPGPRHRPSRPSPSPPPEGTSR